jgi:hypothetical protein
MVSFFKMMQVNSPKTTSVIVDNKIRTRSTMQTAIKETSESNSQVPLSNEKVKAAIGSTLVNITVSHSRGIGSVLVKVHNDWAPLGAERFIQLVDQHFYDEARFFRVLKVSL